jgi:hypothetical protein
LESKELDEVSKTGESILRGAREALNYAERQRVGTPHGNENAGKKGGSVKAEVLINRAPVLTLWASVVAECLGFDRDEALTLGRAVAGLNAYAKGKSLGIFRPAPKQVKERKGEMKHGESLRVDLLHRAVPVMQTPEGLRAASKERPISLASVERSLQGKFGDTLDDVRETMMGLARSISHDELTERAYELYEEFRPEIPSGTRGWGAKGVLDPKKIAELGS